MPAPLQSRLTNGEKALGGGGGIKVVLFVVDHWERLKGRSRGRLAGSEQTPACVLDAQFLVLLRFNQPCASPVVCRMLQPPPKKKQEPGTN